MFFSKTKILGLDISDSAVKAVILAIDGFQSRLEYSQIIKLEPGIVERGLLKKEDELLGICRQIPAVNDFDSVVFVIPEEQTFFHHFQLNLSQDIDQQVEQEAKNNIPLGSNDLVFTFNRQGQKLNSQTGLIVGCSRQMLLKWQAFFQKLNWPVVFDTAPFALLRGIFKSEPILPVCLVDIGEQVTNIIIFSTQGLVYEHTISYAAGQAFTQKISQVLKISLPEAEALKKLTEITRYGENEGAAFILRVILESIAQEVKTALEYCSQQCGLKIKNIVLTGGSSQLKGLLKYYNSYFSVFISKPYRGGEKIICQRGFPWLGRLPAEYTLAFGAASLKLSLKAIPFPSPVLSLQSNEKDNRWDWVDKFKFSIGEILKYLKQKKQFFKTKHLIILISFILVLFFAGFLFLVLPKDKSSDHLTKQKIVKPTEKIKQFEQKENKKEKAKPNSQSSGMDSQAFELKPKWAEVKDLAGKHLNVRLSPSLESMVISRLSSGEKIEVLGEDKEWVKIKLANNKIGWVYKKFINISQ